METYLVEHYRPGLSTDNLAAAADAVRLAAAALAANGRAVRYLRSTIIAGDEAYLTLFEAASEADVRAAYASARVPFARISEAIPVEPHSKEESCAGSS